MANYIVAHNIYDFTKARQQLRLDEAIWVYKHDMGRGLSNHHPVYVLGHVEDYDFAERLVEDEAYGYIQVFEFELETKSTTSRDIQNDIHLLHILVTYHQLLIREYDYMNISNYNRVKIEEQRQTIQYLKDQIRVADGY